MGDIPYLRLRYVSRILLDGIRRKIIKADDVGNISDTVEDTSGEKGDGTAGEMLTMAVGD